MVGLRVHEGWGCESPRVGASVDFAEVPPARLVLLGRPSRCGAVTILPLPLLFGAGPVLQASRFIGGRASIIAPQRNALPLALDSGNRPKINQASTRVDVESMSKSTQHQPRTPQEIRLGDPRGDPPQAPPGDIRRDPLGDALVESGFKRTSMMFVLDQLFIVGGFSAWGSGGPTRAPPMRLEYLTGSPVESLGG